MWFRCVDIKRKMFCCVRGWGSIVKLLITDSKLQEYNGAIGKVERFYSNDDKFQVEIVIYASLPDEDSLKVYTHWLCSYYFDLHFLGFV